MTSIRKPLFIALALLPLLCGPAQASDIARNLQAGNDFSEENDSYLELGLSVIAQDGLQFKGDQRSFNDSVRVAPAVNARYQWRGWFAEAHIEATAGWTLGYNAFSSRAISLDLTVGSRHGSIDSGISDDLSGIQLREQDLAAGVRLSGYLSNYLWQVKAWGDVSGSHNGHGASALLGRNWQLKNWNLHAMVGAGFSSAKTLDYYYGVTGEEAAAGSLSPYVAGAGVSYSAEVGLTYPLSESWVMRTTARYGRVSEAVADSPLFEQPEKNVTATYFNLSYVF